MNENSKNTIQPGFQNLLKNTPLFSGLSEDELTVLSGLIIERHFSKNQVILYEEDTSRFMYIVFSGKVKAIQTSADGKEYIRAMHGKGDFFGEMGILDGQTATATVIAMEESKIGLLTREDFESFFLKKDKLLKEIILILCSRLREAWTKLEILTYTEAEKRVRAILTILSRHYGVKDHRGIWINFKLTHHDIARQVSLSRETVTRQLDRLQKYDEIEIIENKHILLKSSFFEKSTFL